MSTSLSSWTSDPSWRPKIRTTSMFCETWQWQFYISAKQKNTAAWFDNIENNNECFFLKKIIILNLGIVNERIHRFRFSKFCYISSYFSLGNWFRSILHLSLDLLIYFLWWTIKMHYISEILWNLTEVLTIFQMFHWCSCS